MHDRFAALALIEEPERLQNILLNSSDLEKWRYPIQISISIPDRSDAGSTNTILSLIVERYPPFAAQILREGTNYIWKTI